MNPSEKCLRADPLKAVRNCASAIYRAGHRQDLVVYVKICSIRILNRIFENVMKISIPLTQSLTTLYCTLYIIRVHSKFDAIVHSQTCASLTAYKDMPGATSVFLCYHHHPGPFGRFQVPLLDAGCDVSSPLLSATTILTYI